MLHKPKNLTLKPLIVALALSPGLVAADNPLSQIVVTANNTEQTQRSVTANMHVITREEIEARQYKTVAEALRAIPGINTYSNGSMGSSTTIFMRGLDGKNILVLIDGVTVNEPMGLSGANFNHILINNVERIEVVKGAQSGVWGADAVAGVINIITRRSESDTILNADLEIGSNAFRKLSWHVGSGNDRFDFLFGLTNIKTDGFSSVKPYKRSEYDFERDGYQQTDLSLKLGFNLTSTQRIEANLQQSDATTDYDATTGTNAPNADFYSEFTSTLRQINYQGNFNQLRLKLYAQDNQIQRESFDNFPFKADSSIVDLGALVSYQYGVHQIQVSANERTLENKLNGQGYINTGLGITNTNQFNNQSLIITQAIRSDRYNAFEDKVTGKLGVKNYFTDDIFISANYGTGYRAPNLSESAYSRLKPESTEAHDITLGAYGLEVTYYHQITDNKITYVSGWPITNYRNTEGKSTFEGMEVLFKRHINAIQTDLNLSYTHLIAKDSEGKWFARRPEQQANISLDFYGFNNTRLGLETRYIGTTYDKADQKGAQIGEYFVTDITADYQLNKHISLYSKVQNLFNEDFIPAVAAYEADDITPRFVYGNGGTQYFVGIRGKL
ncbi:TonB-dependent siderophore receptor [Thiomicrospira sp. ALE5]|uniref:TonB-dependent receptor plug domain-containing protein n=1 Tax=Thiomicrospira sp. ALE5 TaxID=748650 RepID=UPI0008F22686|nr:TonB-dependent receptor [Thiomicrospira sp. ALE5]SFR58725.1 vitamin B12 transporter [Thiomicrospira sp. ALE5]